MILCVVTIKAEEESKNRTGNKLLLANLKLKRYIEKITNNENGR